MKTKINIFFYNTLVSKKVFELLFMKYNVKSSINAQKFFHLLATGFIANDGINVIVHSLLPINSKDQKKRMWKFKSEEENGIVYEYFPLINIPILRNIFLSILVFFKVIFKKYSRSEENIILVDYLRFSIALGVFFAAKLRRIKIIAVVTDLPGYSVSSYSILPKLKSYSFSLFDYDLYVCLTKDLNNRVNRKNRPSIIIEGFVDNNLDNVENKLENKFKERVIVYAGGLFERYGIKNLIEAFTNIKGNDLRLWIFGVGPFSERINNYSQYDNRIVYKGFILNHELMEILQKSTLLINPRPTNEEYTKYSFPSKNIEFMSTGTPLITTKLHGIPKDHYPFIYFINDETAYGIYESLMKILNKNRLEIHEFGLNAKQFVLEKKNNVYQANQIIKLIN